MKKSVFIIKLSLKRLFCALQSTAAIIISLAVCTAALLLLMQPLLEMKDAWLLLKEVKRTWQVEAYSDAGMQTHGGSEKLYEELMYENSFGEISEVILPQVFLLDEAGTYYEDETDDYLENNITLNIYVQGNSRFVPETDLVDGRMFSEEEIENGSSVILLSIELGFNVGDTFTIKEDEYEVIGIISAAENAGSAWITESNALSNENFYLSIDKVIFSDVLSKAQEEAFAAYIKQTVGGIPYNYYSDEIAAFAMELLGYALLMALVIWCAFGIILQLFGFMVRSRRYEFGIYKMIGVRGKMLAGVYFAPVVILDIFGCAFGFLVYKLALPLLSVFAVAGGVPPGWTCAVIFAVEAVSVVTVVPGFVRLKKRSAVYK